MTESEDRMSKADTVMLGRLTDRETALEMRSMGYKNAEIAHELQLPEASVRKLLADA